MLVGQESRVTWLGNNLDRERITKPTVQTNIESGTVSSSHKARACLVSSQEAAVHCYFSCRFLFCLFDSVSF